MRRFGLILLIGFCFSAVQAADFKINKVIVDNKTVYMVDAGAFPYESNAEQLKAKLSTTFKQPVAVNFDKTKKLYVVTVGPIADLQLAKTIQQDISGSNTPLTPTTTATTSVPLPSSIPPINTVVEKKLWNLRNADIRAVIAEVSRVTGKNFIVDPRVQGKISIVSATPISDKELYQVFLSVLQVSGYAAIPSGQVIKIVPNIDAKTVTTDLLDDLRHPPRGDDMMVEVVPVRFVPAEQLIPVLRPLMPQWSNVSAYGPSNMLILSGRASNIHQLANIIRQVDTSTANGIDMVPLKYALAMDIAGTLKDLIKTQPGMAGHAQVMLAADDRSNSILISGSRTDRLRLRLLISRLDKQNPNGTNSNTQVVYLSYLRAEDLVPILAGIAQANFSGNVGTTIGTITRPELDSTNPASNLVNNNSNTQTTTTTTQTPAPFAANPSATPNTSGATTQNEGTTKPTVQIIAEPNTNSIIINAPVSLIRILKSVIGQLDIRPAQLLIEALVAEVDAADINSLGIEWGSVGVGSRGDNLFDSPVTPFRPGFAIINSQISIDNFQAQLYGLVQRRKANVLSTPSVVVLDNRQAKILVGKQISVASTSYPNNGGGTTVASPYTTFDRVNVALHLYVRPQITRGNGIHLQIDQGNDTIDPSTALDLSNPIFKISSIVTSVHVESGNVVVLGGLTQDSLGTDNNGIPIIGDIPGLGRFFQHNVRSREKRVLMVFIRPIILRTPRDAVHVTGSKYNDLRQDELAFLRSQDYDPNYSKMILPPLKEADLPKPFSRSVQQKVIMTK
ncbi:type II protein secretion LspD [Legionella busanensis]|uniref:Type II protein secretion LspD n=1 Tax=Legionella busanensis TaxID=190655 RepID=A0A378JNN8_9GAMM|nr:GspD family T2SS secretin variant LspD [Legionella busanensis]STX51610.1 type II protein secretion LspD [Legionella busanensis]